jgi:hypothetical protein
VSAQLIDQRKAFLALAREIAFQSPDHGSHRLYARLKAMYEAAGIVERDDEYEATARELARMAGV